MIESDRVKIVVFTPLDSADAVRAAMSKAGAGIIGKYSDCSFSSRGICRFFPEEGSSPATGAVGKPEQVEEERIEMICPKAVIEKVVTEMLKSHPYEEVAYDIYPLLELKRNC